MCRRHSRQPTLQPKVRRQSTCRKMLVELSGQPGRQKVRGSSRQPAWPPKTAPPRPSTSFAAGTCAADVARQAGQRKERSPGRPPAWNAKAADARRRVCQQCRAPVWPSKVAPPSQGRPQAAGQSGRRIAKGTQ